jgi:class 3 adenylate cyclase/CHASE2 domain-containing sensor protein
MASNRLNTRFLLVSGLLALAACGLAFVVTRSVAASDLELWAYDFLINHGGYSRMTDNIVVVDFDNEAIQQIRRFPVPRTLLADVITRVSSAKPRVIGLDFFLTEPRDPAEDAALQKALTQAGNVIVASQLGTGGLPSLEPLPFFCQPEAKTPLGGFCEDGYPGAFGFAFVNVPLDNDGFVRSMLLLPDDASEAVSFPLAIAQQYSGEPIRPAGHDAAQFLGRRIPYVDSARKTTLISWNREPDLRIPALAILQNKIDVAKTFANKVVLIGQSSDAARDRFFTPVFRASSPDGSRILLSGVEVNAAAIHTLLDGPAVSVLSFGTTWAVTFVVIWLVAWLTLRVPLRYGFFAVGLAMLGVYGGAQLLMVVWHCWMKFVGAESAIVLVLPLSLTYQFVQERFSRSLAMAERQQIMDLFSRYVSPEVAKQIWRRKDEIVLAGEERTATVLFSDIRSFTALSAGKAPQQVLQWLNRYLTAMDEVITQEGGFLNKFLGDGLMVLFGVPLSKGTNEDAACAVRCALRMLKRVEELNTTYQADDNYAPIRIGIGIHTGRLTAGNVGSAKRLEYSVIGETVNLASRLESLTKELHTPIVISADTEKLIRECFDCIRELGEHTVRGLSGQIHLYTVDPSTANRSAVVSSTSRYL